MAEQEKDTSAEARGEALQPPVNESEQQSKATTKGQTGAATKGTSGETTVSADGKKPTKKRKQSATPSLATTTTTTPAATTTTTPALTANVGSDATQKGVYTGEEPMEAGDRYRASQGRDPLKEVAPDDDPQAGMSTEFMAKFSPQPIAPHGGVPTGAPHSDAKALDKAIKPVKDAIADAAE